MIKSAFLLLLVVLAVPVYSKNIEIEAIGRRAYSQCQKETVIQRRQCNSDCGNFERMCYERQLNAVSEQTLLVAGKIGPECKSAFASAAAQFSSIEDAAQANSYLADTWSYFDIAIELEMGKFYYAQSLLAECPSSKR